MSKFKVGDRVQEIDWCGDMFARGKIYTVFSKAGFPYIYSDSGKDGVNPNGYPTLFKKIRGSMSKYDELKDRIDGVTRWDKEADDILQEIGDVNLYLTIKTKHMGDGSGKVTITDETCDSYEEKEKFYFNNQCEKLTAFKTALIWLLDNSSTKKDLVGQEVKADVEGKTYKVKILEVL